VVAVQVLVTVHLLLVVQGHLVKAITAEEEVALVALTPTDQDQVAAEQDQAVKMLFKALAEQAAAD
jgi:hypothetical protein